MVSGTIIPFLPDWLAVVLIIAIAIIIYIFLPPELKDTTRKYAKKYGFFVLIFLIWLYYRKRFGFIYENPTRWPAGMLYGDFMFGLALLLWFSVKSWLYEQRYYTYSFISDNISGSCKRYQEIGSLTPGITWIILFIGTSGSSDERFVFPWPWAKKLVIVPKCACQFIGNHIIATSQVSRVLELDNPLEIPEEIKHFLDTDPFAKWCKDEVYFGMWDIKIKSTNPKYEEVEALNKKLNTRINEQNQMLRGKLTTVKAFVSDTMAVQDRLKGGGWGSKKDRTEPREE